MPTDPLDPAATSTISTNPATAVARPSHDVEKGSRGERHAPPGRPTPTASADAPSTVRGHRARRSLAIHLNHLRQVREAVTQALSRALPSDGMTLFNAAAILFGLEVVLADGDGDGDGDGRCSRCTTTTIGEALSSACRFAAAACLEWMRLGENVEDVAMLLHPDRIALQPSGQLTFEPPGAWSITRH